MTRRRCGLRGCGGLLAVLLVHANAVVSGDRLVEAMWRDALPVSPVGALQTLVSWLRRALGAPEGSELLTRSPGYLLRASDQVDALRFTDLVIEARGPGAVSVASLRGRHGDPSKALPLFRDLIEHWHQAGNWTQQWTTLRNLVGLLVRLGAYEAAAVLYGAQAVAATAGAVYGADAARLADPVAFVRKPRGGAEDNQHTARPARSASLCEAGSTPPGPPHSDRGRSQGPLWGSGPPHSQRTFLRMSRKAAAQLRRLPA
ncbi:MAG: AfsR/SARP family transcriptional regulator [Egibacteraceae bacterium]